VDILKTALLMDIHAKTLSNSNRSTSLSKHGLEALNIELASLKGSVEHQKKMAASLDKELSVYSDYLEREKNAYTNKNGKPIPPEGLLGEPFLHIASQHQGFKNRLINEHVVFVDWIVSQKAFKELAIEFGEHLGISKDETIKKAHSNEEGVLNNTFIAEHKTRISDIGLEEVTGSEIANETITNLKKKIKKTS